MVRVAYRPQTPAIPQRRPLWDNSATMPVKAPHVDPTNLTLIYAIFLGTLCGCLFLWHVYATTGKRFGHFCVALARAHLYHPLIITRRAGTANFSRFHALVVTMYISANVACTVIGVHSLEELSKRSSTLFSINMLPLYFGGRTNIFLDRVLGVSRVEYTVMHHWAGRVCATQGLIHGAVKLGSSRPGQVNWGLVASTSKALTLQAPESDCSSSSSLP